jgi:hypothetical protein
VVDDQPHHARLGHQLLDNYLTRSTPALAALAVPALLAIAVAGDAAQVPARSLTSPASPQRAPATDGFIQRWLLLESIGANGLTDSVIRAAVKKEYFPNQFTVIPRDGDKVTVGGAELTWHAVDTKNYNVNRASFCCKPPRAVSSHEPLTA